MIKQNDEMVRNCLKTVKKWFKIVQNGPNWSNIFKMVLYGPIGSKTVQNGP